MTEKNLRSASAYSFCVKYHFTPKNVMEKGLPHLRMRQPLKFAEAFAAGGIIFKT
jgi:hypothetical protein